MEERISPDPPSPPYSLRSHRRGQVSPWLVLIYPRIIARQQSSESAAQKCLPAYTICFNPLRLSQPRQQCFCAPSPVFLHTFHTYAGCMVVLQFNSGRGSPGELIKVKMTWTHSQRFSLTKSGEDTGVCLFFFFFNKSLRRF